MIVLGLTGSIGMGKSTAARMLAQMGCAVHDSDACVRRALAPHGAAFEEVALSFPQAWDKKTHTIKRDVLAGIIFKDPAQKKRLESILHPIVRRAQQKFIQNQIRLRGRGAVIVLDIPLLFETGAQNRVDYTLVVSAPPAIQRRRVLARRGMSIEKFNAILATQISDAEKRALADFVIPTGMGLGYTYASLTHVLEVLKP